MIWVSAIPKVPEFKKNLLCYIILNTWIPQHRRKDDVLSLTIILKMWYSSIYCSSETVTCLKDSLRTLIQRLSDVLFKMWFFSETWLPCFFRKIFPCFSCSKWKFFPWAHSKTPSCMTRYQTFRFLRFLDYYFSNFWYFQVP